MLIGGPSTWNRPDPQAARGDNARPVGQSRPVDRRRRRGQWERAATLAEQRQLRHMEPADRPVCMGQVLVPYKKSPIEYLLLRLNFFPRIFDQFEVGEYMKGRKTES